MGYNDAAVEPRGSNEFVRTKSERDSKEVEPAKADNHPNTGTLDSPQALVIELVGLKNPKTARNPKPSKIPFRIELVAIMYSEG
jgi:hypothetical protein